MLNLKILALTLIPLFSAGAPKDGVGVLTPLELLGIHQKVSKEFLVGNWRHTHDFFRWGTTDKSRATIKRFPGFGLMRLKANGSVQMFNLFKPAKGKWRLTDRGLLITDPLHPERGEHLLPVRKKSDNRIWILLPFTGGASGIGLTRISDERIDWVITRARRDEARTYYVPPKKKEKKKKVAKKKPKNPEFEMLKKNEIYTEDRILP